MKNKNNLFKFSFVSFCFLFLTSTYCQILPGLSNDKNNGANNLLPALLLNTSLNGNGYNWNLPANFPVPRVPRENPMSEAKVELGRFLFYDTKLSDNQTQSCGSCHLQEFAFTDRKPFGIGSTGDIHPRNSQNLANVGYNTRLTWANNLMIALETQVRTPMFGENPIELGLTNNDYLDRLKADSQYRELFSKAYGGGIENINEQTVRFALASFQRSLISGRSRADKYLNYGDNTALTASERRGLDIYNGETAECFHCHGGFNYSNSVIHTGTVFEEVSYLSNGILSDAEYSALPDNKKGLFEVTRINSDIGLFKPPSLRNIELTYPYMHDGSFTCTVASLTDVDACSTEALGKVIDHYASGGKSHSNKDSQIRAFSLTPQEKTDLINFLKSLTDDEFLTNPKFSNPFN